MSKLVAAMLFALVALAPTLAVAQVEPDFPTRPIKLVVSSTAGGGADAVGRLLAEEMAKRLRQPVIIENKPGSGGRLGSSVVAGSPPDGYTVVLGTMTSHILSPGAMKKPPYDPVNDFTSLGQIGTSSILLVAVKDFTANNLTELATLVQKEPTQYASWGLGSTGHFCIEVFAQAKNLKLDHIPYSSTARIMSDMLGGHIKLAMVDMATGTPFVQNGSLKALAVCTRRSPSLPDVPSYPEQGIDFDQSLNWSMHGPAGLPSGVRAKLEAALEGSLKDPALAKKLLDLGVSVDHLPGAQFADVMRKAIPIWREVAQKANISLE